MVLEMRKMKDSGIEWIGEIPEGWEIIPVKYLAKYIMILWPNPVLPTLSLVILTSAPSLILMELPIIKISSSKMPHLVLEESSILVIFLFLPLEHTYAQLLVSMNTDCLK